LREGLGDLKPTFGSCRDILAVLLLFIFGKCCIIFEGAKELVHQSRSVLRRILTQGTRKSVLDTFLSKEYIAMVWAICFKACKNENFKTGPCGSVFGDFCTAFDQLNSPEQWNSLPVDTLIFYPCPQLLKKFHLNLRIKKAKAVVVAAQVEIRPFNVTRPINLPF
jgi:hypothetical protein